MPKFVMALISVALALSVLFIIAVQLSTAAPVAAPDVDQVTVCTWLGCKPGAVSYTQDDDNNISGPNSCRAPLDAAGFRGTFFYNGVTSFTWMADYTADGHEVGSHLADHTANCVMPPDCYPNCTPTSIWETPYVSATIDAFRADQIDPNVSAIEAATNRPVVAMAYPCGNTDNNRRFASKDYFLGARSYTDTFGNNFWWVLDVNPATPPEPMMLYADTYFSDTLVDRAISEGKWAIFTMHDVCVGIDYLDQHRDSLWVAPVGDVMKYIKVRDAARFANYTTTSNSVSFDAGHSLSTMTRETLNGDPLLSVTFNNTVTLNADVPLNNGISGVTIDGTPVSFTVTGTVGSAHGVLITTSLEITRHVEITLTGPNAVQLQDISVRSNGESGENLGWLLAMIVMGAGGLVGALKANRRQPNARTLQSRAPTAARIR